MRIIIFTGRGGSGVSTLAAATAVAIAGGGQRTLAFGLGPGLGAVLGELLSHEPKAVAKGLDAAEGGHRYDAPDEFRDWLGDLLDWRGMQAELAEDLAALPGMNHVGRLLDLEERVSGARYDCIVVDGAPLDQFLGLPPGLEAAARWLERLFAPREQSVFEPFIRVFAGDYAETGEEVFDRGRELLTRLAQVRQTLVDSDICSVRVVLPPDGDALASARGALSALSLFSFATDALLLSPALPAPVKDPFFAGRLADQEQATKGLAALVKPMPVLTSTLSPRPPRGASALADLAAAVYGSRASTDVLHRGDAHSVSREGGRYVLSVVLPFARKDDLSLEQGDDGVAVHLNGRRAVFPLPEEARHQQAVAWTFEPPVLRVTFG